MPSDFLDPIGKSGGNWDEDDYTYIDDGVRQPTTPSTGTNQEVYDSDKPGNIIVKYTLGNWPIIPNWSSTNWFRVYYYVSVSSTDEMEVYELEIDDDEKSPTSTGSIAGTSWKYAQFNENDSRSSVINSNSVSFRSPSMSNGDDSERIAAIYVECNYNLASVEEAIIIPPYLTNTIVVPPWLGNRNA